MEYIMRLKVSADGYVVTGDRALKHFGCGVASLNEELNNWIILLDNKDSIIQLLQNSDITKPRFSLFHDRIYVIIEGDIQEEFHYIIDIDDYQNLINQIKHENKVSFGVLNIEQDSIEKLFVFDIIT